MGSLIFNLTTKPKGSKSEVNVQGGITQLFTFEANGRMWWL